MVLLSAVRPRNVSAVAYDAKIYNVMIASPGDVELERSIIREVVADFVGHRELLGLAQVLACGQQHLNQRPG